MILAALFSMGCPKSDAVIDASPASSAPLASASQVNLAPLGDTPTASVTAADTATRPLQAITTATTAKPTTSGTAVTTATTASAPTANAQAQIKQCCAALRKQSQQPSAQQAQLGQAAAACDALATAMGGATPQLDQVKMLLQGVPLPPVCQGL